MNRDELHKRLIEVAAQSPAKKRKVGAVICLVREFDNNDTDYEILAEGYNYNLSGGPCETEDNITHENVIHAEVAALNNLNHILNENKKYIMFCTHPPCDGCKAQLLSFGITYEVMGDFLKFDSSKPRMALVPASLGLAVGAVVTYGAKKYKTNNWRKVKSQEPYINALERHLAAYKNGETHDPESGLSHMAHIACNAAFLLELSNLPLIQEDN